MKEVVAGLVILAIPILVIVVLVVLQNTRRDRHRFFEASARRLKGRFQPGGFLSHDLIVFPVGGIESTLEFIPPGEDNGGRTVVSVFLPEGAPGTLHILPEGFGQSFLKRFGAQDLSVGDAAFDGEYVVKATPESLAARVFAPERRTRVMAAVRRLSPFAHPTIELTRFLLRVQVREEIKHEGGLVALAKTAEEFLEFLELQPPASGIELGEVQASRSSSCPVCGTAMDDLAVRCESCKTPHHVECWKYMGRCSTYACPGKRCVA